MADTKAKLLQGLNTDLQGEFQAVIMYRLYASMVQRHREGLAPDHIRL